MSISLGELLLWVFVIIPLAGGVLTLGVTLFVGVIGAAWEVLTTRRRQPEVCPGCDRPIGTGHYARCPVRLRAVGR